MPSLEVNGHSMYYEVSGVPGADKAVVMGGWGTFCHGRIKMRRVTYLKRMKF